MAWPRKKGDLSSSMTPIGRMDGIGLTLNLLRYRPVALPLHPIGYHVLITHATSSSLRQPPLGRLDIASTTNLKIPVRWESIANMPYFLYFVVATRRFFNWLTMTQSTTKNDSPSSPRCVTKEASELASMSGMATVTPWNSNTRNHTYPSRNILELHLILSRHSIAVLGIHRLPKMNRQ